MSETARKTLSLLIGLCLLAWAAPQGRPAGGDSPASCCCGVDAAPDACCGGDREREPPPCDCDDADPYAPQPPAAPGVGPVVWTDAALPAADPPSCAPGSRVRPAPLPRARGGPLRHVIDCVFLL